jgi:hypothetical protein
VYTRSGHWNAWTSLLGLGRTIWVVIPPPRVDRLHVHRWRWRLLNRLIWVAAERTGALAVATLPTAACVHTATQNGEHEDKATYEDVRPIACYQTLEVLFLLGSRNWGVRLLRRREEGIRGRARRVCTVHADLDKVGERGGRVGYGEQLNVGIAAIVGCILDEISIIKERIKVAHYAMRENRGMKNGKVMMMKYAYRNSCQESCHRIQAC